MGRMAVLELVGVSKDFPGVRALKGVTVGFRPGSVHALCGENGAGKSTLLKILAGMYRPDSGEVTLDGKRFAPASAADALSAGVSVIYQELLLVPRLSVAENVLLGRWPSRFGAIDRGHQAEEAGRLLKQVGLEVDVDTPVEELSISARQMVEIAKALGRESKVIAFDEPTSSLSQREVTQLFSVIRSLKDAGKTILYVTHRMEEVAEVCDAATVLRDGELVRTHSQIGPGSLDSIVADMVGRDLGEVFPSVEREVGPPVLEVSGLVVPGLVEPVELELRKGEVVGVFGLVGAGRTSLLKGLFGSGRGEVKVDGRPVTLTGPRSALAAGIAYLTEDRKGEGIFAQLSVEENMNLPVRRGLLVRQGAEARRAESLKQRLGVRATPGQTMSLLSGGNQQKALLARWIDQGIKVLLLDEPTRGIDIGAKKEVYEIVFELARAGVAVLVVSSELQEILGVSDRILIMREGRLVASRTRGEASSEELLRFALPAVR